MGFVFETAGALVCLYFLVSNPDIKIHVLSNGDTSQRDRRAVYLLWCLIREARSHRSTHRQFLPLQRKTREKNISLRAFSTSLLQILPLQSFI
jgi:hypothetical protein